MKLDVRELEGYEQTRHYGSSLCALSSCQRSLSTKQAKCKANQEKLEYVKGKKKDVVKYVSCKSRSKQPLLFFSVSHSLYLSIAPSHFYVVSISDTERYGTYVTHIS